MAESAVSKIITGKSDLVFPPDVAIEYKILYQLRRSGDAPIVTGGVT